MCYATIPDIDCGRVAQRLAQEAYTFKVPGSNPGAPTHHLYSYRVDIEEIRKYAKNTTKIITKIHE